jgi:hypothetical protein
MPLPAQPPAAPEVRASVGSADTMPTAAPAIAGSDRMFRLLTVLAIPLMALVVFRTLYQPVNDPDTFWHLRLGDYLLKDWNFRGPEQWSSLASRPLVFHEWAPELVYISGYRIGGYPALAWIQAAGGVCLLVTLYLCARRFAPALVAAISAIAGFAGASASVAVRPQMVTFILVGCVTTAWLMTARDGRPRWWLIPVTFLWACSHGMWFVGVAIGLVVLLGMALDRTLTVRLAGRLVLIPVLSVVVAALTPVGPSLLLTAGGMRDYTEFVLEWDPPSLFLPQSLVTVGMAVLIVIAWTRTKHRTRWTEIGLWFTGLALTLMYARTIALGAIILCVLGASVAAGVVNVSERVRPSRRLEMAVLVGGTLAALLLGPAISTAKVGQPGDVPLAFDSALSKMPTGTVVFNDYALGGWLLWAHPRLDPVIDGRADVYDIEYFKRTVGAYSVARGWDATVRASRATAAVLPPDSPLAEALRTRLGWRSVGVDEGYALLVAPQ